MSDTHRPAAAGREAAHAPPQHDVSPAQKRWNDENEKRGEDARKRAEEIDARRAKAAEEGEDTVAWPYDGLIPPPMQPLLHVIPAGMWSYQQPQTPALESMVPPSDEADPNFEPTPEQAAERDARAREGRDAETARMTEPTGAMPSAAARAAAREANHHPRT